MSSSVASRHLMSWSRVSALGAVSGLALLALMGPVSSASAQQSRPRPTQQQQAQPVVQPQGPLIAVVSIGSQKITIYNRDGVVATSPISSGRSGYDTPQGIFSIIERKEEHFSNLYDDAPMPFMQRITWSGVALHAGALPGYPASHGCIRLPHSFAQRLFKMTKLNTRVVVAQRDAAPLQITHAALFQPSVPGEVPIATAPKATEPKAADPAPRGDLPKSEEAPMMLGLKPPKPDVAEVAPQATRPQRAVATLVEAARAQRAAAQERAALAVKAADQAKLVVKTKLVEAQKAERAFKGSEVLFKRAEQRLAYADRLIAQAKTEAAIEKAKAARDKIAAEVETLRKAAEDLKTQSAERAAAAKEAVAAVKATDVARVAAQTEARDAARRAEPISVFISRRTGKLYIRQGFQPIFETAVEIKEPTKPIGTHVFTAIDEVPGKFAVNWTVVTVDTGIPEAAPQQRKRGEKLPPPPAPTTTAASAALDRIDIPKPVLERITPYLQVGSSLIISDRGPSIEQGKGTDFVILTRGEEQAAASIAKYIAERKAGR